MDKLVFSKRLKQVMHEQNLRQIDVLEKAIPLTIKYSIKLTKSDLSQYISGKTIPGVEKLSVLSQVLNVNDPWLLGFNVPKERFSQDLQTNISPEIELIVKDMQKQLKTSAGFLGPQDLQKYLNLPYLEVLDLLKDLSYLSTAKSNSTETRRYFIYDIAQLLSRTNCDDLHKIMYKSTTLSCRQRIEVYKQIHPIETFESADNVIGWEVISPEWEGEYFALMVFEDTMEPKFSKGDVVIVRKQPILESGEIGIVIVNGTDATIKKFVAHDEGGISLIPLNPKYSPKYYTNGEIDTVPIRVLGKVVELRAKF